MRRVDRAIATEALLAAAGGAIVAAALAWFAPRGGDIAAHIYQRSLYIEHGFALWNNFWYAGRYSFVSYSVLYYPLAALVGIRVLAVLAVATTVFAFSALVLTRWGRTARWSAWTFAVVWAGTVLTAAFPFALGSAIALTALLALQAGRRIVFGVLLLLTLAASPVAFLLVCVVLAAVALERRPGRHLVVPGAIVGASALLGLAMWRAFPAGGAYPFSLAEASAACVFCLIGLAVTWRIEGARLLHLVFLLYLVAVVALFLVPSSVGENVARLRYVAVPIAVLVLSLRRWRPRVLVPLVLGLAIPWNVSPLAAEVASAIGDPASDPAYWSPAVSFLHANLTPSYRVEAVDTRGHWASVYLARADIPLARGWFRQDDFPQNGLLYDPLRAPEYLAWLRRLAVRYVVVPDAAPEYGARQERKLIASGRSGLVRVLATPTISIYEVPRPQAIVSGPQGARVLSLTTSKLVVSLRAPGRYRVAVRWSPYWRPSRGCVSARADAMTELEVARAGNVELGFAVNAGRALRAVAGGVTRVCAH